MILLVKLHLLYFSHLKRWLLLAAILPQYHQVLSGPEILEN